MNETEHKVKPESQSISKCAELRQECRDSIFEKMDDHHTKQMDILGDIKQEIAFRKGQEDTRLKNIVINSQKKNGNGKVKDNWIKFFITWGPPFIFIIILGFISWMKTKGYF